MPDSSVYTERRNLLLDMMPESFLAVVPPSSAKPTSADGFYHYTPSMNLVYLTGVSQPRTWLVMYRRKGGEALLCDFLQGQQGQKESH